MIGQAVLSLIAVVWGIGHAGLASRAVVWTLSRAVFSSIAVVWANAIRPQRRSPLSLWANAIRPNHHSLAVPPDHLAACHPEPLSR